jgi:hypothetical protein
VVHAFVRHPGSGKLAQLIVYKWKQIRGCPTITLLGRFQKTGYVCHPDSVIELCNEVT